MKYSTCTSDRGGPLELIALMTRELQDRAVLKDLADDRAVADVLDREAVLGRAHRLLAYLEYIKYVFV